MENFLKNDKIKQILEDIKIENHSKVLTSIKNNEFSNDEKTFIVMFLIKQKISKLSKEVLLSYLSILDINYQSPLHNDSTILMYLIEFSDVVLLEAAFSLKFNTNIQDSLGNTIIHYLIKSEIKENAIISLINKINTNWGCNLNIPNNQGETSLSISLNFGFSKLSEELMLIGADLKYINKITGDSMLHYAVKSKNPNCVYLLTDLDPTYCNFNKLSSIDLAKQMNYEQLVKLLHSFNNQSYGKTKEKTSALNLFKEGHYKLAIKQLDSPNEFLSYTNDNTWNVFLCKLKIALFSIAQQQLANSNNINNGTTGNTSSNTPLNFGMKDIKYSLNSYFQSESKIPKNESVYCYNKALFFYSIGKYEQFVESIFKAINSCSSKLLLLNYLICLFEFYSFFKFKAYASEVLKKINELIKISKIEKTDDKKDSKNSKDTNKEGKDQYSSTETKENKEIKDKNETKESYNSEGDNGDKSDKNESQDTIQNCNPIIHKESYVSSPNKDKESENISAFEESLSNLRENKPKLSLDRDTTDKDSIKDNTNISLNTLKDLKQKQISNKNPVYSSTLDFITNINVNSPNYLYPHIEEVEYLESIGQVSNFDDDSQILTLLLNSIYMQFCFNITSSKNFLTEFKKVIVTNTKVKRLILNHFSFIYSCLKLKNDFFSNSLSKFNLNSTKLYDSFNNSLFFNIKTKYFYHNSIGIYNLKQRNYILAENHFKNCLNILLSYESNLGTWHRDVVSVKYNLSLCLFFKKEYLLCYEILNEIKNYIYNNLYFNYRMGCCCLEIYNVQNKATSEVVHHFDGPSNNENKDGTNKDINVSE